MGQRSAGQATHHGRQVGLVQSLLQHHHWCGVKKDSKSKIHHLPLQSLPHKLWVRAVWDFQIKRWKKDPIFSDSFVIHLRTRIQGGQVYVRKRHLSDSGQGGQRVLQDQGLWSSPHKELEALPLPTHSFNWKLSAENVYATQSHLSLSPPILYTEGKLVSDWTPRGAFWRGWQLHEPSWQTSRIEALGVTREWCWGWALYGDHTHSLPSSNHTSSGQPSTFVSEAIEIVSTLPTHHL